MCVRGDKEKFSLIADTNSYPVIISKLILSKSQSSYAGDSSLELLSLTLSSSSASGWIVVGGSVASSFSASIFSVAVTVTTLASVTVSDTFVVGTSILDRRLASTDKHDTASRQRMAILLCFNSMLFALVGGQVESRSKRRRKKFSLILRLRFRSNIIIGITIVKAVGQSS